MKTLDKEFTSIKINRKQVISESEKTLLRFQGFDLIIDYNNLTIEQESIGSMDSFKKYNNENDFLNDIDAYIWLFNN